MTNPVTIEKKDEIAVVWTDNPPVNAISHAVRFGLMEAFESLAKEGDSKAIILACKGRTFFAGADISEFDKPVQAPHLQDVFDTIEGMKVPVVAAIFGTALGGGMEATLACHYRVADAKARLGLPELNLGIFPGAGGTQRLPRLIGVRGALDIIMTAKPISASKAKELGIIDHIAGGDLMAEAEAYARKLVEEGKGPRPLSKLPVDGSGAKEAFAHYEAFAKSRLKGRTSPLKALQAVRAAMDLPFKEGLALERNLCLEAKDTFESKALRHIFFAERKTRKIPGLPEDTAVHEIANVGILGAGTMGGGIAMCFANAGLPVTLVEANEDNLKRGLATIERNYERTVKRGRLSEKQKNALMANIRGSLDMADLADCDLVIEAVFENMDLKKEVFRKLDNICKQGAILATNTSTLDVDEIAAETKRPEYVLGLHFFSPANIMPLLEVVRGAKTDAGVLKSALQVGKRIRKIPVVSGICFGFIGNRMLSPYGREAQRMLLEGATPKNIDDVLEDFGMAMGVLAVYDLAGIDVSHKVREAMGDKKPDDPTYCAAGAVMNNSGRFGQKTGAGFYRYEKGTRGRFEDPDALALIRKTAEDLGVVQDPPSREEIFERCLYPLVNEGANILDEGIALRASDIDVVWTAGYGFPRHKGGPMFWADHIGLDKILAGMKKYREKFGPLFWEPAPLLERLVREGKTFADWDKENA
ncbi:MAG: enoyl-CoA hydratase/isomerase family protein [Proteobacteria bacterium]|nr:enoyl-CoA hydratase/isomerase family protein [Pseudomonadota bacterium]